ncbi:MAG TPA: sulfite exporter TauE/SafE family protein [Rhodocyclaceae bacterium]|nr:sulfite exporter TauE/SafE family protein [Rhodocyclaceae bacterium]
MIFDWWWLSYLVLGGFVGFFAGLLGIGGGGIMVPVLTTLFVTQGFPADKVVHLALGTSMAAIVLTSVASLRAHHRHAAVRWDIVRGITPGILLGTFGATFLASRLASEPLAIFFAVFMAYVSLQMLANIKPKPTRQLPGAAGMSAVGLGIGGVSALVAIGGGSLSVPFMTWCNVKVHHAIGTSAAIGLPIALAGTVGYLVNGWGSAGMPALSLGFIYLPALVLVSAVSMYTAPLGAKLAHRLPVATLKKVFAGVLLALCAKMLHSVLG